MNRKQSVWGVAPENSMSRQHESLIRIIARTNNLFEQNNSSRFHETNKPKWKDPNKSPNNEIVDVKQPGLQQQIPFGLTLSPSFVTSADLEILEIQWIDILRRNVLQVLQPQPSPTSANSLRFCSSFTSAKPSHWASPSTSLFIFSKPLVQCDRFVQLESKGGEQNCVWDRAKMHG